MFRGYCCTTNKARKHWYTRVFTLNSLYMFAYNNWKWYSTKCTTKPTCVLHKLTKLQNVWLLPEPGLRGKTLYVPEKPNFDCSASIYLSHTAIRLKRLKRSQSNHLLIKTTSQNILTWQEWNINHQTWKELSLHYLFIIDWLPI